MTENGTSVEGKHDMHLRVVILLSLLGARPPCLAQSRPTSISFDVVESQFHARDQEDAGEVRICLQNTSRVSLSHAQLGIHIASQTSDSPDPERREQKYVYARLLPPVLPPGQHGQLVAKLLDRPAKNQALTCTLSATDGTTSRVSSVVEPVLWISYVGFSQDLRTVFVYLENCTDEVVRTESLQVDKAQVENSAEAINRLIPPKGKGCLMCRLSRALVPGEFTHVAVSARKGPQAVHLHGIVRAINKIPLMMVESGTPAPDLGLDLEGFTETMVCIAHAHGTPAQAAGTFWQDYVQRFGRNPQQVIQLDICRADAPRAWFRFGSLPDIARMNPILSSPPGYDREDHQQCFHPFFHRGHLAKEAVEPCRYLAVIPIVPEEGLFLQKELTPQEVRFLVYSAVASGAKGLGYRGTLTDDPLYRSAFVRLNKELRQLEPLLLIGEPIEGATTTNGAYAVKSLLCGDQALLVTVFDRRYFGQRNSNKFYTPPFRKVVTPVRIDVTIPGEVSVGQVRSLSAPLDRGRWAYGEGHVGFTADMIDSAQVYLVDLQPGTQPSGIGE